MRILHRLTQRLGRVSIGRQLYGAFAVLLLLTAVLGSVALNRLAQVDAQASALAAKWLSSVGLLSDLRAAVVEVRAFEVKDSQATDKSYRSDYEDKIAEVSKRAAATLGALAPLVGADDERALAGKLDKVWRSYQQSVQRVSSLAHDGKQQDAADISDGAAAMAFDETVTALDGLTKYEFDGGNAAAERVAQVYRQSRWLVLVLLASALGLGLVFAVTITRGLLRQLGGEPRQAVDVANAVALGDLTTTVPLQRGDDHSLMARLQAMQASLTEAVTTVRRGSENVASASAQIAQGNQDLSDRTEQQASALQKTAATMDELGATVRNNADNAQQANELALGASSVAVKGGAMVQEVVQTMRGINDSSKKISDIVSVIDGIAFQTNILALNAAVEAARAGEQGRGFAVVASEVRSLAQRSAEAAKEIKSLIQASVERVEQGCTLVDTAGQTMTEIVSAIKRVTDIVAEISSASHEQSAGVALVGQAVTQMDHATQANAALVEQSAAAADSMRQQAQQLVQAVAVFTLHAPGRT